MKTYEVELMTMEAMYALVEVEADSYGEAQDMAESLTPYADFMPESGGDYGYPKAISVQEVQGG